MKFAIEGARVVINYNKSRDQAEMLLNNIIKFNVNCLAIKADVTDIVQVRCFCRGVIDAFGRIDVLVNNAGICNDSTISLMSEQQWSVLIATKLNDVFNCSKVFSKEMIKRQSGKTINITSLKGQIGSEGQSNYCASKSWINWIYNLPSRNT
jgi:3-oxoacyl-[acyl-carrier protein] reductase